MFLLLITAFQVVAVKLLGAVDVQEDIGLIVFISAGNDWIAALCPTVRQRHSCFCSTNVSSAFAVFLRECAI